ncbi:YdeI/OmpD-associated family protein [Vicingaceae bacterium]|nr:YdeI/OmpD-associated family protein [Vicingaceae bacterium]MDB4061844.1 YdeI/OmpD-associated family protein [Vicingaceae bacterium]
MPKTISEYLIKGKDRRVIVLFNNEIKNHCAIMSSQEGPFIMLNKGIVKQLKINTGDVVKLEIVRDTSEYGMPICEEFEAVIFRDEVVFNYFQALTPGKQRNLIHLVKKIKNPDIKINMSMTIAKH